MSRSKFNFKWIIIIVVLLLTFGACSIITLNKDNNNNNSDSTIIYPNDSVSRVRRVNITQPNDVVNDLNSYMYNFYSYSFIWYSDYSHSFNTNVNLSTYFATSNKSIMFFTCDKTSLYGVVSLNKDINSNSLYTVSYDIVDSVNNATYNISYITFEVVSDSSLSSPYLCTWNFNSFNTSLPPQSFRQIISSNFVLSNGNLSCDGVLAIALSNNNTASSFNDVISNVNATYANYGLYNLDLTNIIASVGLGASDYDYNLGLQAVLNNPNSYGLYTESQFISHYNDGVQSGRQDMNLSDNGFLFLLNSIILFPFNFLSGFLNVEILGVNLFSLFSFVITLVLIGWFIRKFIK